MTLLTISVKLLLKSHAKNNGNCVAVMNYLVGLIEVSRVPFALTTFCM